MASLRMTLLDLLNKSEQGADPNFLRDGVQLLAQELMDAEVTDLVGADPHQRTAGLSKIGYPMFTIVTLLGAIPWNFALAYAGYQLGVHYQEVATYLAPVAIPAAIVVVILLGIAWWWGRKLGEDETEKMGVSAAP
jgi:hypothetical protein